MALRSGVWGLGEVGKCPTCDADDGVRCFLLLGGYKRTVTGRVLNEMSARLDMDFRQIRGLVFVFGRRESLRGVISLPKDRQGTKSDRGAQVHDAEQRRILLFERRGQRQV